VTYMIMWQQDQQPKGSELAKFHSIHTVNQRCKLKRKLSFKVFNNSGAYCLIGRNVEGGSSGLIVVLSWNYLEHIEENHGKPKDSWCLCQYSNLASPEYRLERLLLEPWLIHTYLLWHYLYKFIFIQFPPTLFTLLWGCNICKIKMFTILTLAKCMFHISYSDIMMTYFYNEFHISRCDG
jgi:hypothetical protein